MTTADRNLRPAARVPIVAVGLLALALTLLSVPAGAAAARVEVLEPGDGRRVYGKSVVVRIKATGPKLQVTADGNDVTRRFRGKGAVRRARLRLGRDFSAGSVTFVVGTGPRRHGERRTDSATVTVLRRKRSFAHLRTRRLNPRHSGPFIEARARKRLHAVRVWVNGDRVRGALETRADLKGLRGVIGAHTGLRYGRNRVVVELQHRNGVYDRERTTFRIPRDAPLASAGEDLELRVGDPAVLDGSRTRFAGGARAAGDGQTMQWEIVQAPEGSSVALEQPASTTPGFTPDVPGTYTVRLTAADGGDRARDDLQITVGDSASEVGIPLVSIGNGGEVLLGSKSIPGGQPYHMVVLDENGVVLPGGGNQYFGVGQEKQLLAAVKNVDSGRRVLLTGGGVDVRGRRGVDADALEQAIVAIGGTVDPAAGYSGNDTPTPNGARDLADGHWTVFGHRGLLEGHGVQSIGVSQSGIPGYRAGEQGQRGSLNGYLQEIDLERLNAKSLEYVSPEAIKLDTKYDCTARSETLCSSDTHNVVQIGTQLLQSPAIAPGELGMHLLVFSSQGTRDGGASGLPILINEAYPLNYANGTTNEGYVQALAGRLDRVVNQRSADPATAQPVIILQTFGAPSRQGTAPKTSPFWANDQVPRSSDVKDWENGAFPTKPSDLVKMWNPRKGSNKTPADYATIAGLVGQLAGVEGHDMVANFGYGTATVPDVGDPEPKSSTSPYPPHHELGLTVVASPHSSDPGDGYARRQTDPLPPGGREQPHSPLDGSVVGTLRRNNQGQFRLTNPSLASSLPYRAAPTPCTAQSCPTTEVGFGTGELWQLAFRPPTPFGCSAEQAAPCSSASAAVAAMQHIAQTVFPTSQVQDVRALYVSANTAFDGTRTGQLQNAVKTVPYPGGDPGFTEADLDQLKGLLAGPDGELQQVANVRDGIHSWQALFGQGRFTQVVDAQQITEKIVNVVLAEEDEAKLEAEIDAQEAVSAGLLVVSELAEIAIIAAEAAQPELSPAIAAVPSVIGVVAESTDFATAVTPEDQSLAVAHDEEQIRTKAADIGSRINDRYTDIRDNLYKLNDIFVSDAGKLAQASKNFSTGLAWSYGDDSEVMQARATEISTSRELYEGLMPLAFQLAVVSPHRTGDQLGKRGENTNGPLDDLRTYNCTHVVPDDSSDDWTGSGTLNPFEHAARSAFHTLHHRRQDAPNQGRYPRESGTGAQIGLALKGRKAKFNAQDIDNEFIGIRDRGSDPPAGLTDPLFRIPKPNDGTKTIDNLRMSKDEFFAVDRWQTRKIQCGPS
jgi:hypothetical protein